MAIKPIHEKFQNLIETIQKGIFRSTATNPANRGIGERIVDSGLANQIYGDSDTFMGKYRDFERQYYEELSDIKNVRKSFAKNLDVDMMRNTGSIDLSILNLESRKKLENVFAGSVLKIEDLFANAGLPARHLPSSSPYRTPAMFEVEQGLEHPAQVMLNKMIFNIDPTSNSVADVRFGSTNITSADDLERNLFQIGEMRKRDAQGVSGLLDFTPNADGSLKKVVTFDVETTGLGSMSQVRSVSLAQRTSLDGMAETVEKFGYNSPRMGGILAGPQLSDTLSGFIAKSENMGSLANNEEHFLQNMKKVMKTLNDSDQVTGHNVNFDITQMLRTMSGMKGYHADEELKGLVSTFLDKKKNNKSFLIDTLELGRAYITDKAQQAIGNEPDSVVRGEKYIKQFFSTESLADVTTGGKSTYAGVENFVMNTNLIDLMADEQHAPQIFEKILSAGSHVAETDTMLQDHILKYMHTGKLDFRNASNVSKNVPAELLDIARRTVFKSAATTAVTNIADPKLLTDTALSYAQGEGLSGVRATISLQDVLAGDLLADPAKISTVQNQMNNNIAQGFIKSEEGKFKLFTGAEQEGIALEQSKAESHLRSLIAQAKNDTNMGEISALGQKFKYNRAEKQIMSLGISFEQNTAMEIMNRTLGTAAAEVDPEKYVDNIANLYKNFAETPSKLQFRDIMRGNGSFETKMNFATGLNLGKDSASDVTGKLISHAESSLASGNKYGFLGVKPTVISNILASGTSSLATEVYNKANLGGFEDLGTGLSAQITERFAYAASNEIADVTSQFGISHYKKQSSFRLAGEQGQAKKILLDYDYFKSLSVSPPSSAVGAATGAIPSTISVGEKIAEGNLAVSFSVAERKDQGEMFKTLNLVWKQGQDESGLTARSIAEQLHADFIASDDFKGKITSLDDMDELHTQAAMFKETYKEQPGLTVAENREKSIQAITESIEERGVGIASFGDKYNQDVVESMTEAISKNGMDIANDTSSLQANILGEAGDTLALGHVYDKKVIDAGGATARNRLMGANKSAMEDASKVGEALLGDNNLLHRAVTNLRSGRRQTPISTAVESYHKFKGPAGIAALGLTALAAGYYIGKRKKETNLYDETLQQQPTESFRQNASSNYGSSVPSLNSARRDPLVTAGVVGNLDNRKIGHTQMGNNKYNHLYGG